MCYCSTSEKRRQDIFVGNVRSYHQKVIAQCTDDTNRRSICVRYQIYTRCVINECWNYDDPCIRFFSVPSSIQLSSAGPQKIIKDFWGCLRNIRGRDLGCVETKKLVHRWEYATQAFRHNVRYQQMISQNSYRDVDSDIALHFRHDYGVVIFGWSHMLIWHVGQALSR